MQKIITGLLVVIFLLISSNVYGVTYYIDYATGSDANNGTSKTKPWKHAPGMQGALITDANNNPCRARTHSSASGDTIILKGGVTWPSAALSWDWYFGDAVTVTVDNTWYSGASWTRPVLDNEGVETTDSPEGISAMLRLYGKNHTVDNIEFKGVAQLHGGENGYGAEMLIIGVPDYAGGEVKNCYFHGWRHGGTATNDNTVIVASAISANIDMKLSLHDNIWDGSDSYPIPGDMATAYRGRAGHFYRNYIGMVQNGQVSSLMGYVWGNTFYRVAREDDFDPTMHHQCYQAYGDGDTYVYNNLAIEPGGGSTYSFYPENNYDVIFFNNVVINDVSQTFQCSRANIQSTNSSRILLFNNTMQSENPMITSDALGKAFNQFTASNNLLIGNMYTKATGLTYNYYVEQKTANARLAGYDDTEPYSLIYPFYPPSNGATVGKGTNLSSWASSFTDNGPSTPSTACLYDATLGVSVNSTNHTVSYPNRTPVLRGSTWDIGAYQFSKSEPTKNLTPKNIRLIIEN